MANRCVIQEDERMISLREELIAHAGYIAGYVSQNGLDIPAGVQAEHQLMLFCKKKADEYVDMKIEEPFILYMEAALEKQYKKGDNK